MTRITTPADLLVIVTNDYTSAEQEFAVSGGLFVDLGDEVLSPDEAPLIRKTQKALLQQLLHDPEGRVPPAVAMVVNVAGRPKAFPDVLRSLAQQSYVQDHADRTQVLLIQDGSDGILDASVLNEVREAVKQFPPHVQFEAFRLASDRDSRGRATARNIGIWYAQRDTDVIFFLDDAMILERDFVAEQVLRHKRVKSTPLAILGFKENREFNDFDEYLRKRDDLLSCRPDFREDLKCKHTLKEDEVTSDEGVIGFDYDGKHYKAKDNIDYMAITRNLKDLSGKGVIGNRALPMFFHTGLTSVSYQSVFAVGGFETAFDVGVWGFEDSYLGLLLAIKGVKLVPCPSSVAYKVEIKNEERPFDKITDIKYHRRTFWDHAKKKDVDDYSSYKLQTQIVRLQKLSLLTPVDVDPRRPLTLDPAAISTHVRYAFRQSVSGDMLGGEGLGRDDLESGRAIEPQLAQHVFDLLRQGKNVAIQGGPGAGKSAFAAWVHWLAFKQNQSACAFFGSEEQERDDREVVSAILQVPRDWIIIIDDIHLITPVLKQITCYAATREKRFLLLGRSPRVKEALERRELPEINELIEITAEDTATIAKELAHRALKGGAAAKLLENSGNDLVLTKWLLDLVELRRFGFDIAPKEAAKTTLKSITNGDGELLRLFLTLAAFRWVEVWCSADFLIDALRFDLGKIEGLKAVGELTCDERPPAQGGHHYWLMRHSKLCKVFLDAAPELGPLFSNEIVRTTGAYLQMDTGSVFDFPSLILGSALAQRQVQDLQRLQWGLAYGDHSKVFEDILKVAVEVLSRKPPTFDLTDRILRLDVALTLAMTTRRNLGGQAATQLLNDLRSKLGPLEFPPEPFAHKGRLLYEDAYIKYLNNELSPAIARFKESADADVRWGDENASPRHRVGAAMSRNLAAAAQADLAIFSGTRATLTPDDAQLRVVLPTLEEELAAVQDVRNSGKVVDADKPFLDGTFINILLELADIMAWSGDRKRVQERIKQIPASERLQPHVQERIQFAEGVLAHIEGDHQQVIDQLAGQLEQRLKSRMSMGEGAGKIVLLLLLAYQNEGMTDEARKIQSWFNSDGYPVDSCNGAAREWARLRGLI